MSQPQREAKNEHNKTPTYLFDSFSFIYQTSALTPDAKLHYY